MNQGEEWRAIPGYPYEVSSYGRVRRTVRYLSSTKDGVLKSVPSSPTRYPRVTLSSGNKQWGVNVHQLVAEAFLGPKPVGKDLVAHSDGNPHNNRLENLRWATYAENEADKKIHGRAARGERQHLAKLTEDKVRAIRASPESLSVLGRRFGVAKITISHIKRGRTWKHIA